MTSQWKKKVLVLVEGAKTDVIVMEKLFHIYQIDAKYEIVSYCTNIYILYQEMFYSETDDFEDLDILQVLKSREKDGQKKKIFDEKYTDIILVFDLDPQDPRFNAEHISIMQEKFAESSDMGKLYLNYPMVEAFYNLHPIPDDNFNDRIATLEELKQKTYKHRVRQELSKPFDSFLSSKAEFDIVILQNISKALFILGEPIAWSELNSNLHSVSLEQVLHKQLGTLESESFLYVLCTCIFYILDYNKSLLLI